MCVSGWIHTQVICLQTLLANYAILSLTMELAYEATY